MFDLRAVYIGIVSMHLTKKVLNCKLHNGCMVIMFLIDRLKQVAKQRQNIIRFPIVKTKRLPTSHYIIFCFEFTIEKDV